MHSIHEQIFDLGPCLLCPQAANSQSLMHGLEAHITDHNYYHNYHRGREGGVVHSIPTTATLQRKEITAKELTTHCQFQCRKFTYNACMSYRFVTNG